MLSHYLKVLLVLTAAICLSAPTVLATITPDPEMSIVQECLVTCPAGDRPFLVTVLDETGTPCPDALVTIDFCGCPDAQLCLLAGGEACGDGTNDRLVMATDANGDALFHPAAGGACADSPVDILADGVLLATRTVRAFDANGNFIVEEADMTFDVWNDYNCDGVVNITDTLLLVQPHGLEGHTCEAPVGDENRSWGGVKSLWR